MALDKVIDSTQLDNDLTAVAEAIRAKSGVSETLEFPDGFISAIEIISGSGGTELNFEVIGSEKEPEKKENTIWINTSIPINGYVFQAEWPDSADSGAVWIQVGNESSVKFSALSDNTLWIYPLSAMQFINGDWKTVEAKTYIEGEWKDWITYLYKNGVSSPALSEGWTNTPELSNGNLVLTAVNAYGSQRQAEIHTNNTINLTGFKTLSISCQKGGGAAATATVGLSTTQTTDKVFASATISSQMDEINIELNGVADAFIIFYGTAVAYGTVTFTIKEMKLLR